ncbi:MAG: cryptochrome/photolyase family protein [Thiotrichales bacterium]
MLRKRKLLVVLGDQLNIDSPLFDNQSKATDLVWMAEVEQESRKVWSHKARIALFLSAMRHFARTLKQKGWRVDYYQLDNHEFPNFQAALKETVDRDQPDVIKLVHPGEYDVLEIFKNTCNELNVYLEILEDPSFIISREEFKQWKDERKTTLMEHFYRFARVKTGYLVTDGKPVGGKWNFDSENRNAFSRKGPGNLPAPVRFEPDGITRAVIALVNQRFADHPGNLEHFDWLVSREDALLALEDFIDHRLPSFGYYQDAMWVGEPWLYHSRLSVALNLKLLDPREVIEAALKSYISWQAPVNSVEGFIRQILGWREYIRQMYWDLMPELISANALHAEEALPSFYWDGETDMTCMHDAITQTLEYGYAHHIQRLMVTGLFAQLYGVNPRKVHEWYLAVYVDAVEWVEAPNTLSMSQFADGGKLASKPYVASGKYIQRMSNACEHCRFDPALRTGSRACPFTTLYWEFMIRHQDRFKNHPRLALQWRNLQRLSDDEIAAIRAKAMEIRTNRPAETAAPA